MKRFKIVNGKWIEELMFPQDGQNRIYHVLKISEIKALKGYCHTNNFALSLEAESGITMTFTYEKNLRREYETDLEDLKKVIGL